MVVFLSSPWSQKDTHIKFCVVEVARENLPALGGVTCSSSGLSITPHAALGGGDELQKARLFEP